MVNLEQLKQDVNNLPEEAQILVTDFIESLKKRYSGGNRRFAQPGAINSLVL